MKVKRYGIVAILVTALLFLFLLGPYNPYHELNEDQAIKPLLSSDGTFKGNEIIDLDYKGSDTYEMTVLDGMEEKTYIVIRSYTSVMNGHWEVYEQSSIEGPF
ncbi:hypothetical protein EQV77_04475 [Halobacillus fulvus]|nr:hypothetical protein EQV77_04475 [Halobacillus fulvus]